MVATITQHSARTSHRPCVLVPNPGPVRVAIAALHDREIGNMPRQDLIDMIRMSSMTSRNFNRPVEIDRLGDRDLTRLAFLVRRCCRNQLDAHRHQSGQPMLWREAI